MSAARDAIPRSTMTAAQQRRIGALQAAKAVLCGTNGGYGHGPVLDVGPQVTELMRVAKWIDDES